MVRWWVQILVLIKEENLIGSEWPSFDIVRVEISNK